MKQFSLVLLSILLTTRLAYAQHDALNGFIEQHKNDKAFTYAFLSKDLFEVATQLNVENKDWKKLHNVVKNIGSLSILTADSIFNALTLYREVRNIIPEEEFDELLTVRDGQENVRIWVKEADAVVTDLVLLVGSPEEFVLICFAGNLELGNISELVQLFEADELEQLTRTTAAVNVDFKVSPNPSKGEFTLTYSDEQDPPASVTLFDQNGRQVSDLQLSGFSIQQVMLPDLPAGFYWLQMKTRNGKIGVKQVQIVKG